MTYPQLLEVDERRELLRIARATLREYLDSARIPPGKPHRASLLVPAAVTVSLHRGDHELAVATTELADRPLFRAIQEVAVEAFTAAGLDNQLTDDDLSALVIEITVASSDAPQVFRDPVPAT